MARTRGVTLASPPSPVRQQQQQHHRLSSRSSTTSSQRSAPGLTHASSCSASSNEQMPEDRVKFESPKYSPPRGEKSNRRSKSAPRGSSQGDHHHSPEEHHHVEEQRETTDILRGASIIRSEILSGSFRSTNSNNSGSPKSQKSGGSVSSLGMRSTGSSTTATPSSHGSRSVERHGSSGNGPRYVEMHFDHETKRMSTTKMKDSKRTSPSPASRSYSSMSGGSSGYSGDAERSNASSASKLHRPPSHSSAITMKQSNLSTSLPSDWEKKLHLIEDVVTATELGGVMGGSTDSSSQMKYGELAQVKSKHRRKNRGENKHGSSERHSKSVERPASSAAVGARRPSSREKHREQHGDVLGIQPRPPPPPLALSPRTMRLQKETVVGRNKSLRPSRIRENPSAGLGQINSTRWVDDVTDTGGESDDEADYKRDYESSGTSNNSEEYATSGVADPMLVGAHYMHSPKNRDQLSEVQRKKFEAAVLATSRSKSKSGGVVVGSRDDGIPTMTATLRNDGHEKPPPAPPPRSPSPSRLPRRPSAQTKGSPRQQHKQRSLLLPPPPIPSPTPSQIRAATTKPPSIPLINSSGSSLSLLGPTSDAAYQHAQNAGLLWQTLVAQHVRFPPHWFNGARSPMMGVENNNNNDQHPPPPPSSSPGSPTPNNPIGRWKYLSRHRIRSDPRLVSLVKTRRSSGRLLLHVVIRDNTSWMPVEDVAIGCYHPSARGVRKTDRPNEDDDDVREVWMAIRRRMAYNDAGTRKKKSKSSSRKGMKQWLGEMSLVDPILTGGKSLDESGRDSPLGDRKKIDNRNMRAIFGDEPPKETVFILEDELYKMIVEWGDGSGLTPLSPALLLLQEFVFRRAGGDDEEKARNNMRV